MKALELANALDRAPYSCGCTMMAADEIRHLVEVNAELLAFAEWFLENRDGPGGSMARDAVAKAKEQQ